MLDQKEIAEKLVALTMKEAPVGAGGLGFYWQDKGPMTRAEVQELADVYWGDIVAEYANLMAQQSSKALATKPMSLMAQSRPASAT